MCRFTYGLRLEDGLSNMLYVHEYQEYVTSKLKETLWFMCSWRAATQHGMAAVQQVMSVGSLAANAFLARPD